MCFSSPPWVKQLSFFTGIQPLNFLTNDFLIEKAGVRACREHLQSEGDSAAETPSRNLRSEAVPSQPEISDQGAAETAQAVCQPCNVEPHALSFGVSGVLAQRLCKAAVELDTAAATVWEDALDHERVDLAEVCCPRDSVLARTMLEVGGSARR